MHEDSDVGLRLLLSTMAAIEPHPRCCLRDGDRLRNLYMSAPFMMLEIKSLADFVTVTITVEILWEIFDDVCCSLRYYNCKIVMKNFS